jgi:NAD(P)-dependent dehydrogenase (short-subunit alcohol dehydrogenase family)
MNVAVVGCNRGIGLALVKELKSQGAEVYAFCRQSSEELKEAKPKMIIEDFEVTDFDKMKSKISSNNLPTFDQVYHVSGIMRSSTLAEFDVEGIKEQFEVNSIAPMLSAKAFLPKLAENSKLGLLTSRMGSIEDNDSGGSYGYRMSKSALNAAGRSLSVDLKEQSITVLLLHPGWVKTDMTSQSGLVETDESAKNLVKIMNEKSIEDTGSFWHMNGERLPW